MKPLITTDIIKIKKQCPRCHGTGLSNIPTSYIESAFAAYDTSGGKFANCALCNGKKEVIQQTITFIITEEIL